MGLKIKIKSEEKKLLENVETFEKKDKLMNEKNEKIEKKKNLKNFEKKTHERH